MEACKWVDEVVVGSPYLTDIPYLDSVNCEFIAHGDDIILDKNGKSIYSCFDEVGRMK